MGRRPFPEISKETAMDRKKILLVDDSNTILMMQKMILAKGPYFTITASNGEEAVAKAESENPDLILMDVVMPKMDGFEAVRRIRQAATASSVPIIMVTTRGEEHNIETGYEAGCNDYVTKPIDGSVLMAKLRTYLGQ
jgi:DNA-binding response OmpR family regulator